MDSLAYPTAGHSWKDLLGYRDSVVQLGFGIVNSVFSSGEMERLGEAIDSLPEGEEVRRRSQVYGVRNLLDVSPAVRELAQQASCRKLVTEILGENAFAVRATFFDKVLDANWNLRFHQDGVIAVKERVDTEGYSAWAEKAGVTQVRPPADILKQMLAIRVHLDDCMANNGALRILAGSHNEYWARERISNCREEFEEFTCEVEKGGVLAMRPLALHASSASTVPNHRRVVHIEYANVELPGDLEWRHRIS